jgi:PAS domain S-box-containing protein
MAAHVAGDRRAQGAAPLARRAALLARGVALLAWHDDLSLSTRLMIAMVALVLVTAAAVGFLTDRAVSVAIVPQQLKRLEGDARWLATGLNAHVLGVQSDVLALRGAASVDGIVRAHLAGGVDPVTGQPESIWRDQLTRLFVAALTAKPAYVQLRYVGVADDGREIVRVDRAGGGGAVRVVSEAELQAKGDRPYMRGTLALAAGGIYLSPIDLDDVHGIIETPHVPVLRAATPVYAPDGRPFGALIIDADLRPAFARLRRQAPAGGQVYVFDDRGDYLVHPDPAREFGFELGHPALVQDDFPEFADALASHADAAQLVRDHAGERHGAAFAWVQLAGGPWVGVAATLPEAILTASAGPIRRSTLTVGLVAAVCALLLAALVARSLTRPLARMVAAVERFTGTEPVAMPTAVGGEIGALARAFNRMAGEVRERAAALQHEVDERRRAQAELERVAVTERLFLAVVESSDDAILTSNLDGTITAWNPGAERLFGYPAGEAIGKNIEIVLPEHRRDEERQVLIGLLRGEPLRNYETVRAHKSGKEIAISLSVSPIRSASGAVIGAAKIARDVTERRQNERRIEASLREKELLLGEIHHRVKNNLQVVTSLLAMQSERIADPVVHQLLQDSQNRVRSMALIHQTLYQSGDFAEVDFAGFLDALVPTLFDSYSVDPSRIRLVIDAANVLLPIANAIPCGLLVNELIANALKHAFPDGRAGEVRVELANEPDGQVVLSVSDNGIGIPESLDLAQTETLGLQLVDLLADQLAATKTIERAQPTRFVLRFPKQG